MRWAGWIFGKICGEFLYDLQFLAVNYWVDLLKVDTKFQIVMHNDLN